MNNGYLDLSFSEAVDRTSIDRRLIQLQSTTSGNAIVYNLTGSVTSSPLSATTIRLTLDANDLEALQLEENLCTTPANCHIRLLNGAVADYSGNTVSDSVAQAQSIADLERVTIESVELDMDAGTLTFNFSASVDASATNPGRITIATNDDGDNGLALSTTTAVSANNGFTVVLTLTLADMNTLRANSAIATSTGNTVILTQGQAFTDLIARPVVAVTSNS